MCSVRAAPRRGRADRGAAPGACVGYREVEEVLRLVPWNGRSLNDTNPHAEVRQMVFGPGGRGLVTYLILEDQRRVDVLQVNWVG